DETGAALGIFVLGRSPFPRARLAIEIPVPLRGVLADAILVEETHVKPDRRIERPVLIDAQPGQLVVKHSAVRPAEVTVTDAPVRDRSTDPLKELLDRRLTLRRVLFAIKIF